MAVASDGRNTNAQCHDKGNRHGAGGYTARVKGNSPERVGYENRQGKDHNIAADQQLVQRDAEQHTKQCHYQEQTHAQRH